MRRRRSFAKIVADATRKVDEEIARSLEPLVAKGLTPEQQRARVEQGAAHARAARRVAKRTKNGG